MNLYDFVALPVSYDEREMLDLLLKNGGQGLSNPQETANSECKNCTLITAMNAEQIYNHIRDDNSMDYSFVSFSYSLVLPGSRGPSTPAGIEIDYSQQLSHIVQLTPLQNGTNQGRRCSPSPWYTVDLWATSRGCSQKDLPLQSFLGYSG